MPRAARSIEAGMVDNVQNRRNGRLRLFHKEGDYDAFERVLDRNGPPTYWHPGNVGGPFRPAEGLHDAASPAPKMKRPWGGSRLIAAIVVS